MNGSPEKKSCSVIGTHDGTFHCDEVMACWMLKQLPVYKNAKICRSRDPAKLSECDIVVDVGGVYDPNTLRFDHHQKTFNGSMKSLGSLNYVTRLSSAGLIYLHYGKDVISLLINSQPDGPYVAKIYEKVYEKLIEEIDGVDNGIDQYDGVPKYQVTTTLSSRIGGLNPAWNDENSDVAASFNKAMEVCGAEFLSRINYYKNSWLPARQLVEEDIRRRHEFDESGEILVFPRSACPWKEHLFDIEETDKLTPTIKFVLFQDNHKNWRVQCVPKRIGSFENRLSLSSDWWGLRDEELSSKSGIANCIFVHANGFIGGNKTYEGALQMAKDTLAARKNK